MKVGTVTGTAGVGSVAERVGAAGRERVRVRGGVAESRQVIRGVKERRPADDGRAVVQLCSGAAQQLSSRGVRAAGAIC